MCYKNIFMAYPWITVFLYLKSTKTKNLARITGNVLWLNLRDSSYPLHWNPFEPPRLEIRSRLWLTQHLRCSQFFSISPKFLDNKFFLFIETINNFVLAPNIKKSKITRAVFWFGKKPNIFFLMTV